MSHQKLSIREMQRISTEEFKEVNKLPLVVVLDNIRSLHNIGSIFRTCDAFRIQEIHLCGLTAKPPHAEIHKTALGAEHSVSWTYFEDTMDSVAALQDAGYTLLAVEQAKDSMMLDTMQLDPSKSYAIVMGNEVKGVQQQVIDACDGCIEIPQYGTKHSLNVSVSAGMVIWQCFTQLPLEE